MAVEVNYLAVVLAAISSLVIGSVWYSNMAFGKTWAKLVGLNEDSLKKGAVVAIAGAFVLALLTAYIIAHVTYISQAFFKVSFLSSALQTGFWLWLGISMTTVVTHALFEQRRKKLIGLTIAHQLVDYLVMGAIIGYLGVGN